MKYPHISGIDYESTADGPGIRAALYLSGCTHNCPGCHNPQTHNPNAGTMIDEVLINNIGNKIRNRKYINGITLTGGDPLYNVENTANLIYSLRNRLGERWSELTVWLYTGYTWQQLMQQYKTDEHLQKLLLMIDVIVDGPFIQDCADKRLAFRGSSNQCMIDVQNSLKSGKLVMWNNSAQEV